MDEVLHPGFARLMNIISFSYDITYIIVVVMIRVDYIWDRS